MTDRVQVRRALISVSDKAGIEKLGSALAELGIEIVSTGSTAQTLRAAGVEVRSVTDLTGAPEMLDGRVKTLHPAVHAGILADRSNPEHMAELASAGFEPIDLVVVNLYPFERAVAEGADGSEAIEQIDIGGPTLVRAAAKNFLSVAVVVRAERYPDILEEIRETAAVSERLRSVLAAEAFEHVATYDAAIASWFRTRMFDQPLPAALTLGLERIEELRYGENPHQQAGLYRQVMTRGPLGGAEVLQGKEMSFNNWLDAEAARGVASGFEEPAAAIVKHHNPCGTAVATTLGEAYRRAFDSDPVSAFGGVVAFNREVDAGAAEAMSEVFTEVVIAPGYSPEAREAFAGKKNLRVVLTPNAGWGGMEIRPIEGGALVQDRDS
ncbi:MAG TPA: bifunctional phosphoribosylaminoimidazolecarboxamide formyltransferase/IMP cyclohydrolase, partial [Actinomycetota bacterium]|nr:bifunctional phosphoribosylaminoimidazolecarboxamide formyltransferase/IMP cyclohydrolase [Actinomycetota bacterium]